MIRNPLCLRTNLRWIGYCCSSGKFGALCFPELGRKVSAKSQKLGKFQIVQNGGVSKLPSLKLIFSPLKMDGWESGDDPFLLRRPLFRGVSFRECAFPEEMVISMVVARFLSIDQPYIHCFFLEGFFPGKHPKLCRWNFWETKLEVSGTLGWED